MITENPIFIFFKTNCLTQFRPSLHKQIKTNVKILNVEINLYCESFGLNDSFTDWTELVPVLLK